MIKKPMPAAMPAAAHSRSRVKACASAADWIVWTILGICACDPRRHVDRAQRLGGLGETNGGGKERHCTEQSWQPAQEEAGGVAGRERVLLPAQRQVAADVPDETAGERQRDESQHDLRHARIAIQRERAVHLDRLIWHRQHHRRQHHGDDHGPEHVDRRHDGRQDVRRSSSENACRRTPTRRNLRALSGQVDAGWPRESAQSQQPRPAFRSARFAEPVEAGILAHIWPMRSIGCGLARRWSFARAVADWPRSASCETR